MWTRSRSITRMSAETFSKFPQSHHRNQQYFQKTFSPIRKLHRNLLSPYFILSSSSDYIKHTLPQTRSVAPVCPNTALTTSNVATWLYWRKALIKTEPHCAYTEFWEHIAAMNIYTTYQMHVNINSIQLPITCYIQAPRNKDATAK